MAEELIIIASDVGSSHGSSGLRESVESVQGTRLNRRYRSSKNLLLGLLKRGREQRTTLLSD